MPTFETLPRFELFAACAQTGTTLEINRGQVEAAAVRGRHQGARFPSGDDAAKLNAPVLRMPHLAVACEVRHPLVSADCVMG
jgi:hypothetical protein